MTFPKQVLIGGLPFKVIDHDVVLNAGNLVCRGDMDEQELSVKSTLPLPRRIAYLIREINFLLLCMAGVPRAVKAAARNPMGLALYQLLADNDMTWIGRKKLPDVVTICGLPYSVSRNENRHLDDANLSGEICYTDLEISVHGNLPTSSAASVLIHEITHGMLYECGMPFSRCNDERIVLPYSHFLYLLLLQNDFSFVRRGSSI